MENSGPWKSKAFVYSCSVAAAVMFGMSFAATKGVLAYMEPFQIMAYRWLLALIVFSILAALKIVKISLKGKPIKNLMLLAFMQPLFYSIFETYGIELTTSSESAIVLAAVPVTVILLSVVFLKKRVTLRVTIFVLLSLAGVACTVFFAEDFGIGGKGMGYLMLLGAVLTGALYTLMSSSLSSHFSPGETTFAMVVCGGIGFNVLYFAMGYSVADYIANFTRPATLFPILYLGLGCSILCFFLTNFVLSHIPAPQASTIQINIITVTGVIAGFLIYHDPMPWYKILGVILIVAGVIGANRLESQKSEEAAE